MDLDRRHDPRRPGLENVGADLFEKGHSRKYVSGALAARVTDRTALEQSVDFLTA